jgi:hypothetical protein
LSRRGADRLCLGAAENPSLVEIKKALDPCATFRCEPVAACRVLFGYDESWWAFGIGIALLAYNAAPLILTSRIAPQAEG